MSIIKIKKDIELLEKQLSEIETQISDPIERLEQKKQLEKKIKKLEYSKSQQEEYEREQQELQALKSDFSPNNSNIVEQKQETSSITNNYSNTQSQTNFNQPSDESLDSVSDSIAVIKFKHLLVLGIIFGFAIGIALIINYNLTQQAEETRLKNIAKQEVEQARQETLQAQREAEQARQETLQAQREAEQARQEALEAKQQANDLIRENSYAESPKEFILEHYSNLNNRNYNLTWQHLTSEFQTKSGGFANYTDWWNSVQTIEIKNIQILEQSNNKAILNVQLTYFMNTGTTYKDPKSRIYLVWDNYSNNWLFENKQ